MPASPDVFGHASSYDNCCVGLLQLFAHCVCCMRLLFAIWDGQISIWDGVFDVLYVGALGGTFTFIVCVPFAFNVNILTLQ